MSAISTANRASAIAGKLQHACAVGKISRDTLLELLREIDALRRELAKTAGA